MHDLFLIRHGESAFNADGLLQGHLDSSLTPKGRRQVQRLAESLKAEGQAFHGIVTSPLARARESAYILGKVLDCEVEEDPDWMERKWGEAQGRPRDQVLEKRMSGQTWNPFAPPAKDAESDWEVYQRAMRGLQRLLRKAPGRYAVVAHGGVLNMALRAIAGLAPTGGPPPLHFAFDNASHAWLRFDPKRGTWRMLRFIGAPPESRRED